MELTPRQFDALAELIRLRDDSASKAAAFAVLCEGKSSSEAAASTGLKAQGVANAVYRCRRALDLAKTAAGVTS